MNRTVSVGPQLVPRTLNIYTYIQTCSRCAFAALCRDCQVTAVDKVQLKLRMSGIKNVRVKKRKAGVAINVAVGKERHGEAS